MVLNCPFSEGTPNSSYTFSGNKISTPGYLYDAAGNLIYDGTYTYGYDAENRLASVQGTGTTLSYRYNPDGIRTTKTLNGVVTKYGYDENGKFLWTNYGYGGGTPDDMYFNGRHFGYVVVNLDGSLNSVTYSSVNWLGTELARFGATQHVVGRFGSLPFGDNQTVLAGTNNDTLHFTGKERDAESGNDYFGARYYASSMGRFLSPDWTAEADPVPYADFENPQSLNLYSYVKNNTLSRTDPFGHDDDPCKGIPNCASVTATPDDGPPLIEIGLAFGHHFVDQAIVSSRNAGQSLAGQFFSRWRTGPLANPGLHRGFTTAHRLNSAQIQQIIKNVEDTTGRSMSQWNQADIEKAVEDVQNAGGDVDSFLSHIAENNPTARTVTADVQDLYSAAQAAVNRIQSSQAVQAVEGAAEEVEAACDGGPACIP